ncbi:sigma-70 family RNA polymerase sigma factor [Aquisphaera insulae]|uniref:sigma-70 family RNA polymerase sigma factor n=1 Tax=Aquisphaera insulae TaxID=2712864 RepID=UPI0013ECAB67|nr:sigma-70 family RNA polymerase sigma factor [Aquisphaera insulae]
MTDQAPATDRLLNLASLGDEAARRELLEHFRESLRRMVAVRLDRRLGPRVDASDVVQETLAEAADRLDAYLLDRPLPFPGWLRQIATERIIDAHRRHLHAQRRSVAREAPSALLAEDSAIALGMSLVARDTSPSDRLMRQERAERVLEALDALPDRDREVLVMRHLEQQSVAEIAGALGLTEAGVKTRLIRALARMRARLEAEPRSNGRPTDSTPRPGAGSASSPRRSPAASTPASESWSRSPSPEGRNSPRLSSESSPPPATSSSSATAAGGKDARTATPPQRPGVAPP